MMMEETSIISGATTNHSGDISDSNSSSKPNPAYSGPHHTPSKFKGVVVQPNGHWGTQIYVNHERIWLGTFKSKREAAAAYDSASIKLSRSTHHRNFPWTELTLHEPGFQSQLSIEAVIGMIKDGSYAARFADYVRAHNNQAFHSQVVTLHQGLGGGGANLRQLFQKELTPSDVGKLNRLVIPKKHALKYFPRIPDSKASSDGGGGDVEDLELVFYDRWMRSWKVRYCYWKSSQSFVFTRGWNRFAKEKGLKAKDRVIFSLYESGEQKMFIIDVGYCEEGGISRLRFDGGSGEMMDLESDHANGDDIGDTKENVVSGSTVDPGKKGFRLFGFQIL